jgi:hypothetical protein
MRMLSFVKDMARVDDSQDAHWTASRLRLLSVISPRALTAARSNDLSSTIRSDEILPLVQHTCRVIEDVVDFSIRRGIINCGNADAGFPWLSVLPGLAPFFSARFRDQLAAGFRAGTFQSNGDFAAQQLLLMSFLTATPHPASSQRVWSPPLPSEGSSITSPTSEVGQPAPSLHPLLRHGTPLRVDMSAPQLPITLAHLQDGISVPLTEEELGAAAQDPPTEELQLFWWAAMELRDLRVSSSSQALGACVSVRDVLFAVHAAMTAPIDLSEVTLALELESYWYGAEKCTAASRRTQRGIVHALPDTEPLRWIDFARDGTFFGGCDDSTQSSGVQLHFTADHYLATSSPLGNHLVPLSPLGDNLAPSSPEDDHAVPSLHPLLRRDTSLLLDLSFPQLPATPVCLRDGTPVPLTEQELCAAAQDPPTEEVHFQWWSPMGGVLFRVRPSSQASGTFVTVRDVLAAVHAAVEHPVKFGVADTRYLELDVYGHDDQHGAFASRQAAAAARRKQRSVTHGMADTEPLRWIDFSQDGIFFGGFNEGGQSGLQLHFMKEPATSTAVRHNSDATSKEYGHESSTGSSSSDVNAVLHGSPDEESVTIVDVM